MQTPKGVITFLDTPGHAAFTAMRARGAKATDVVVWWWPRTMASCPRPLRPSSMRGAAGVPIVVAVNKDR
ncbi:MAG: GTP-binding protein [Steroidobacteraceae bacterium]